MSINKPRKIHVLLVEDNPGDVDLAREAMEDCHLDIQLNVVDCGEDATDFLLKRRAFAGVSTPDLIILDLNLPRMSGHEFLEEIEPYPELVRIPVFVLTTSDSNKDIIQSYILQAKGFITKPLDLEKFHKAVESIDRTWFNIVN